MNPVTDQPRITSLFSNETLGRLERLRLGGGRRFTNRSRGEHLAGRGGSSTEFSDYRDYVAGDDLRFVDWNIFSRLRRPYLKLFEQEEERHVAILVDASASMETEGKLDRAKALAAAFGLMGLLGGERVSAVAFNRAAGAPARTPAGRGRGARARLFAFLEGVAPGGDAPAERGIEAFLQRHTGRGVAVVLSDFLTFGDLTGPFNRLFAAGLEPMAVQILGPSERDPELGGDLRLVDAETEETLDVTAAADILGLYQEYRAGLEQKLAGLCRQRGGRFLGIGADEPLETVLFDKMRRMGWIENV